jgi:hypothetical protein
VPGFGSFASRPLKETHQMVARLLLLSLLAMSPFTVQAAAKTEAKPKQAAPEKGLKLTPKALQAGMQTYIREEDDCRSVTFGSTRPLKKGAVIRQKLQRQGADVDMSLDISKSGNVSNLRVSADTKDPAHLTVMLCATYAAIRTLQPKAQSPGSARQAALALWQEAQQKPSTKVFQSSRFKAQMTPFELNAF